LAGTDRDGVPRRLPAAERVTGWRGRKNPAPPPNLRRRATPAPTYLSPKEPAMRFSQKLVCSMLLVVVAFFALGGSALLHGDFLDRLAASAQQEQAQHGMACQVVDNEMLALLRQGDGLVDAALAAIPAKLTAPPDQAHALLRAGNNGDTLLYSSFPAVDGLDAAEPGSLADTMPGPNESVITRAAGRVWR